MHIDILEISPSKENHYIRVLNEDEIKTFPRIKACPACGDRGEAKKILKIAEREDALGLNVMFCQKCSHTYYLNPPSEAQIHEYYKKAWMTSLDRGKTKEGYVISPKGKMASLVRELNLPKNSKILDYGCGIGGLLKGLSLSGYSDVWGCELSEDRYNICFREFKEKIIKASYQDFPSMESFDLIYSNHVVEHLNNPMDFFLWAKQVSPHGIIVTFVPNAEFENVLGQAFFLPHLHSFSKKSLARIGENMGYKVTFWRNARFDEIGCIFYPDKHSLSYKFSQKEFDSSTDVGDIFSRAKAVWSSSEKEAIKTISYQIPSMISCPETLVRSYAELSNVRRKILRILRVLSNFSQKIYIGFFQSKILPTLLKLVSRKGHQITATGFVSYKKIDDKKDDITVSYQGKAFFILK